MENGNVKKIFRCRGERATYRLRPQTAQLQLCFCCSFIFFKTASFSILTRFRRSSSPRPSQNSLMRSRSSVVLVDHILLFFGCCWLAAGGRGLWGADALEDGGDGW